MRRACDQGTRCILPSPPITARRCTHWIVVWRKPDPRSGRRPFCWA